MSEVFEVVREAKSVVPCATQQHFENRRNVGANEKRDAVGLRRQRHHRAVAARLSRSSVRTRDTTALLCCVALGCVSAWAFLSHSKPAPRLLSACAGASVSTLSACAEASSRVMAASRGSASSVGSARLTRSSRRKMRASADAESDAGDAKERGSDVLLHEYEAFQHGLPAASKRRRLSTARSRSESAVSAVSETDSTPSVSTKDADDAEEPKSVEEAAEKAENGAQDAAEKPVTADADKERTEAVTEPVVAVAEVALASEEKVLDGAPEGELYIVTVLASEDIAASADAEAERKEIDEVLAAKEAALTSGGDAETSASSEELSWAKEYAALDSIRRLALHHTPQLTALLLETSVVTTLVCPAAMNLRSAMARNALLCVQDIVQATKRGSEQFFGEIVPLLVQRTGNEKQFIRDLARDVLYTCMEQCPTEALLSQLLQISTTEKNAQIVSSAGVYAQKCMEKMDTSELKTIATSSRESFFEEMSAFLNCKVVDCKVATRKALQSLRKTIGDAEFTTVVKSKLEGTAQFELLKASEVKRPTIAKSGLPKLSMRERMMQMKKQQAANGDAATAKTDDVVVVAVPATDGSR